MISKHPLRKVQVRGNLTSRARKPIFFNWPRHYTHGAYRIP